MSRGAWVLELAALASGLGAVVAGDGPAPAGGQPRRLALLIAVPDAGEWREAAANDQAAVYRILRRRGYRPDEILKLCGPVRRDGLLAFLRGAGRRLAGWPDGEVFIHYTGSGHYAPAEEGRPAEVGLHLARRDVVLWEEFFGALRVPRGVRVTLLPDC
jgi:hypothetical protein